MSNFVKRKLSPEALDEYVLRFVDPNAKKFIPYTTSKNEQVKFSPYLDVLRSWIRTSILPIRANSCFSSR